jgi:hypothetical protein
MYFLIRHHPTDNYFFELRPKIVAEIKARTAREALAKFAQRTKLTGGHIPGGTRERAEYCAGVHGTYIATLL